MRQKQIEISELAKSKGIKNALALQKAMQISSPTVASRLWKGFTRIDVDTLDRLCGALGCTPNDVFGYKRSEPKLKPESEVELKLEPVRGEKGKKVARAKGKSYRVMDLVEALMLTSSRARKLIEDGFFEYTSLDSKGDYLFDEECFQNNVNRYKNKG